MRCCFRSAVGWCAGDDDDGVFLFPCRCGRCFPPLILVGIADGLFFGVGFFLALAGLGAQAEVRVRSLLFSFCLLLGVVLGWCLSPLVVVVVAAAVQVEGIPSCYRALG